MDRRFALFDRPGLAGLALAEAIVTPSEERALIASIDGVELSPFRFQGWLGKRLTASYGWRYNFDTGSFGPADSASIWTGTRVPRNTGFPPMILPINRSLVGARVERLARPGRRRCARFENNQRKSNGRG